MPLSMLGMFTVGEPTSGWHVCGISVCVCVCAPVWEREGVRICLTGCVCECVCESARV